MPSFQFSINSATSIPRAGTVRSDSFQSALTTISEQMVAAEGDTLEIGVKGFPPARFDCVCSIDDGSPVWIAAARLAA